VYVYVSWPWPTTGAKPPLRRPLRVAVENPSDQAVLEQPRHWRQLTPIRGLSCPRCQHAAVGAERHRVHGVGLAAITPGGAPPQWAAYGADVSGRPKP
jgi:hypothetical protein